MKKLIFIYAPNFSGTTLLDLMIGGGDDCFACGELSHLNGLKRRGKLDCFSCGRNCDIWKNAPEDLKSIYRFLFNYLKTNTISDSSKSLKWFKIQEENNLNSQYKIYKLLIYKHPQNWFYSTFKRRHRNNWKKVYNNLAATRRLTNGQWYRYNERVLAQNPIVISYRRLASEPVVTLEKICNAIGIKYFTGKEKYWNFPHHLFSGGAIVRKRRDISYTDEWKYLLPEKYIRMIEYNTIRLFDELEARAL